MEELFVLSQPQRTCVVDEKAAGFKLGVALATRPRGREKLESLGLE